MKASQLVDHTVHSIEMALRGRSRLTAEVLAVPGFCAPATRHFLNNVCTLEGTSYLEVGVFKGATLFAAACHNAGHFTGIDNFWMEDFRDPVGARREMVARRRSLRSACRVVFHDADCWRFDLSKLPRPVNVYFYDGDHSAESHYRAFTHFDPALDRRFVAVVDDWSWERVRAGTRAAFDELGYELLFQRALRTRRIATNGLLVAVVQKRRRSLSPHLAQ